MLAGERNEGKIYCVQHDFDRQQQRDDIPLDEKPQHSDQKQNGADDEVPTDWDHRSFFAKTTAPNRAISISSDVSSNGKRYSVNRLVPIARGLPTSGVWSALAGSTFHNVPTIRKRKNSPRGMPRNFNQRKRSAPSSSAGRFSNMITNVNSTMIAPAYTMIWITARKSARSKMNRTDIAVNIRISERELYKTCF